MENLKINVAIGSENPYEIDTGIKVPQTMKKYYLPTDYKEPLKVKLIDYDITLGVGNVLRILACVNIGNFELRQVTPNLLFKSKDKASDYYLEHKKELNWDYLKN